jgi:hypothetical protein
MPAPVRIWSSGTSWSAAPPPPPPQTSDALAGRASASGQRASESHEYEPLQPGSHTDDGDVGSAEVEGKRTRRRRLHGRPLSAFRRMWTGRSSEDLGETRMWIDNVQARVRADSPAVSPPSSVRADTHTGSSLGGSSSGELDAWEGQACATTTVPGGHVAMSPSFGLSISDGRLGALRSAISAASGGGRVSASASSGRFAALASNEASATELAFAEASRRLDRGHQPAGATVRRPATAPASRRGPPGAAAGVLADAEGAGPAGNGGDTEDVAGRGAPGALLYSVRTQCSREALEDDVGGLVQVVPEPYRRAAAGRRRHELGRPGSALALRLNDLHRELRRGGGEEGEEEQGQAEAGEGENTASHHRAPFEHIQRRRPRTAAGALGRGGPELARRTEAVAAPQPSSTDAGPVVHYLRDIMITIITLDCLRIAYIFCDADTDIYVAEQVLVELRVESADDAGDPCVRLDFEVLYHRLGDEFWCAPACSRSCRLAGCAG